MKRCKKQIRFGFRIDKNLSEELKGKVVQDIAFCDTGEQHFTMVFTDDTYISIGFDGELDSWVDDSGNLHFDKWCQELIRLGIWEVTEDEVKDIIKRKEAEKEKREYEQYLKLKAKYEKPD